MFLLVHDWIPLGPANDVDAVRRENTLRQLFIGTFVTSIPVALALCYSLWYFRYPYPTWVKVWLCLTYGILFAVELEAWWIRYFLRAEPKRVRRYKAMFGNTYGFLPCRSFASTRGFNFRKNGSREEVLRV